MINCLPDQCLPGLGEDNAEVSNNRTVGLCPDITPSGRIICPATLATEDRLACTCTGPDAMSAVRDKHIVGFAGK